MRSTLGPHLLKTRIESKFSQISISYSETVIWNDFPILDPELPDERDFKNYFKKCLINFNLIFHRHAFLRLVFSTFLLL